MGRVLVTLAVLGLLAYLITLWWSRRETAAQKSQRLLREERERQEIARDQAELWERLARPVPPERDLDR